ncbi:hypothetical protein CLUG_05630 [Clavispora lusitaniae ATCC 42720]|uniref:Uncharacterized protein n=1 Tax=Clavispora lusitaniae (strain ATCC 42720) TaxID=306902 RepID=C4YBQ2_CLAL4|nr:uncharacterized protein CLUG_05630 [Clavispora lusitaniae ATCC 42720]EEQ41503.1 hypothetical protein CLUG_05630 [Clavispora lusitaniae ATCC 42720]
MSKRLGPSIGSSSQICLLGGCLLITYVRSPTDKVMTPRESSTSSCGKVSASSSNSSLRLSKYVLAARSYSLSESGSMSCSTCSPDVDTAERTKMAVGRGKRRPELSGKRSRRRERTSVRPEIRRRGTRRKRSLMLKVWFSRAARSVEVCVGHVMTSGENVSEGIHLDKA